MTGIFDPAIFDPAIFDTGDGGSGGGGGVAIVWKYKGDDITADVDLRSARATSRTNGAVGQAYIKVKDRTRDYEASPSPYAPGYFHAGGTVELFVGGTRVWDGWAFRVGRQWAFDVDDTSDPTATPRYWVLQCLDRNLLLQRRFIYNQADPADATGIPDFPFGTSDKAAIEQMLEDFTDLEIDTDISEISTPSEQEAFVLGAIGGPVGLIFEDCSKVTGGVYYVGPTDRVLRYTDDVTVNSPFTLSDTPAEDAGSVGYREIEDELVSDDMATDALVWGAGRGSAQPAFSRYESDARISEFGRWQWSDTWSGMYKEASLAKRAETYVEGSTAHQRGHGDPVPEARLVIFRPGIVAGMVTRLQHHAYGSDQILPVREVTMTFPTPRAVRYELLLSLAYDSPFGIVDDWWGGEDIPIGDPGWSPGTSCGTLIDEFDREYNIAVTDGWGTATNGSSWLPDDYGNGAKEVQADAGQGEVLGGTDNPTPGFNWLDHRFETLPVMLLFRWKFARTDFSTLSDYTVSFISIGDPGFAGNEIIYSHSMSETEEDPLDDGARYHLTRILIDTDSWEAKTWLEESGEPSAYQKGGTLDGISPADLWIYASWVHASGDEGNRFYLDYVRDVTGGFDEPCGASSGESIDEFERQVRRSSSNQLFTYSTYDEWAEWRVIGPGPTYAHGELVGQTAGTALDEQFLEVWYSDIVVDNPDGNPAPTNPPPTVSYTRHASFRRFEYVVNLNTGIDAGGHWGVSDAGGSWASISGKHLMQGIYDGVAIAFPGESSTDGYAYLGGYAFASGDDILFRWRGRGKMVTTQPRLFLCGHEVGTPWTTFSSPEYTLDEDWQLSRVRLDGTRFLAKTWYEGQSEPGAWDVDETHALDSLISGWSGASTSHLSIALIGQQIAGVDGDPAYPWSQLEISRVVHYDGGTYNGGDGGTGTADSQNQAGGWTGNSNRYQTDYPYVPGTLRVWINGTQLRPGIDFLESDPSTGVFSLTQAFIGAATFDEGGFLAVRYEHASSVPTVPIYPDGGTTNPGQSGGRVYRPRHQRQYGWGTAWDGENCNMASGAMLLDRHTLGQFSDVRGTPRSNPPNMRYYSGDRDFGDGTTQSELATAWSVGWGKDTLFMGYHSFRTFENLINSGRGAVVAGIYGVLPSRLRFSATFRGAHAVYCGEQFDDGSFYVMDPLAGKAVIYTRDEMRRYMTAMTDSPATDSGLVLASYSRETPIS